jgi:hypothetical protein
VGSCLSPASNPPFRTNLWKSRLVSFNALLIRHEAVGISLNGLAMASDSALQTSAWCHLL